MPRRWPQPAEHFAHRYRRAREEWDAEPVSRVERGGFGHDHGFHGVYADRPWFDMRRAEWVRRRRRRRTDWREGSGWPHPVYELPPEAVERHLRAYRDRDLARSVCAALYGAVGREADRIDVFARDAVVTLAGDVPHQAGARAALDAAREVPGVRRVRDALRVEPRRARGGGERRPRVAPRGRRGHLRG